MRRQITVRYLERERDLNQQPDDPGKFVSSGNPGIYSYAEYLHFKRADLHRAELLASLPCQVDSNNVWYSAGDWLHWRLNAWGVIGMAWAISFHRKSLRGLNASATQL